MKRHIQIAGGKHVHIYGWIPDTPDHRDLRFRARAMMSIPPKADVSELCSRIEDQGQLGSCTANSSTSAVEYLYRKEGKANPELSRLFVYYMTRKMEGTVAEDSGCMIRDVMTTLASVGCPREDAWPYDIGKFTVEPPKEAEDEAQQHKLLAYRRCDDLQAIKQAIAEGYPVVGGFSVPQNMETWDCAHTGVVQYPKANEQIIGGHAVLFVGYNDERQLIRFANSWGETWGDKGFGYLEYRFFTEGLADDFWVLLKTSEYDPTPPAQAAA